ncbi:MAG TPA: MerR family transcriptional regulator [Nitrospiria bacterium]|jgi:MerR family transcriptional regulator/heat shock protein HspR|nr:MerR family transcriptional regulator [Nitrospiria bacterium]
MPKTRRKKPRAVQRYVTISTVCEVYRLRPQTLRIYERRGLIRHEEGILEDGRKTVLYGDRDLQRIRMICSLTRDLGVNLAGIEVIVRLLDRLEKGPSPIAEDY